MRIALLKDLPDWRSHLAAVEEIFFTSSAVQRFTDEQHRARFKQHWLGRYLDHFLDSFFVALAARDPEKWEPVSRLREARFGERRKVGQDRAQNKDNAIIGYLAGCLENPLDNPLFADLGYYRAFAPHCASYPCHLHINVAAQARSGGVGAALIEAFAAQVTSIEAPGLHLVTNEGARNVRFYEQNGFKVLATTLSHGTPVVFMGRRLD